MYDLGPQFITDYNNSRSFDALFYQKGPVRITVLTERLIRFEYNENNQFEDRPTSLVKFRNFPKANLKVREDASFLEIKSKYFILTYSKGKPLIGSNLNPTSNLRVDVVNSDKTWYLGHPEARNMGGIGNSFDSKNIKGLYSLDGFATLDDSKGLILSNEGIATPRKGKCLDLYLFVYKKDFELALQDYYILTGKPLMLPRFAFGNWWSKNTSYDEADIRYIISKFERCGIPISTILLDTPWHIRNNTKTGFTFNKELIKEPNNFIKELNSKHIYLGLNLEPEEGIMPYEENYSKIREFLKVEDGKIIPLLPFNHLFIDAYLKALIHPLEKMGVSFFWLNYNPSNNDNLKSLLRYHSLDCNRLDAKREFIMSYNGTDAPHTYGIVYSGKTENSFKNLEKLPEYYIKAANMGLSYVSANIGGYQKGIENDELYIRYVELGCFSPIFRFYTDKSKYYKREPWNWNNDTQNIVKEYMLLRHRLIPYIYTEAYNYYKYGKNFIRPVYYDYPESIDEPLFKNEYMFGSELLIAPIVSRCNDLMNRAIRKFFLPNGVWYDFNTGKKFPGGKSYASFYRKEDYPIFGKAGSIIPLANHYDVNKTEAPSEMEIHIFPGRSNNYVLYEDDGLTNLYKTGYYIKTSIDYNYQESNYTVIIRAIEGKTGLTPPKRTYKIRFRNVRKADEIIVYIGDKLSSSEYYIEDNDFVVTVRDVPILSQLSVNCKGKNIEIDALRVINEDIESIISDLQIDTVIKDEISDILFSNQEIKKKRISIRKMKKKGLEKKFINLFLKLLDYIGETETITLENKQ